MGELYAHHFRTWKLDGLFTPGENFVKITQEFVKAKDLLFADSWNKEQVEAICAAINELHPTNRELDTGFFYIDPEAIKQGVDKRKNDNKTKIKTSGSLSSGRNT